MECAKGWNAKDLGAKISWDANLQGKPLVQGNNEKGLICTGFLSIGRENQPWRIGPNAQFPLLPQ